ncbi:FadR/GntR family transcriptional regulator [Massilia yuzhufengensis]|uniref:Transcriptional regulator, GntR family n=1 Tax=Massilia yuzhufengensis TaxID=1164594 RepID=A0A1I1MZQ3_9BURK|nr:FCD domain-containing protein [Massilia yuzhufengensis]SFC90655.1 transcriptional regulator, GntR family [Massilia yuzhufengensis]
MGTMETNSSSAAPGHPALAALATDAGARPPRRERRPYQLVARRVHELAIASAIGPGGRLPSERELAVSLAVSRACLRQALALLELDGIVEVRSCSGIYLRALPQPGPGPFELLSARRLIEPEMAAMAARVATDSGIAAIHAAADALEQVQRAGPGDRGGSEQADRHFHLTLAHATGNAALASMLEHLWSQRGGLWHTLAQLLDAGEAREETLADYRRIVAAVSARDPAGARNAMRTHLERFTRPLSRG